MLTLPHLEKCLRTPVASMCTRRFRMNFLLVSLMYRSVFTVTVRPIASSNKYDPMVPLRPNTHQTITLSTLCWRYWCSWGWAWTQKHTFCFFSWLFSLFSFFSLFFCVYSSVFSLIFCLFYGFSVFFVFFPFFSVFSIYHKAQFMMLSQFGFDLWWPWQVNDLGRLK